MTAIPAQRSRKRRTRLRLASRRAQPATSETISASTTRSPRARPRRRQRTRPSSQVTGRRHQTLIPHAIRRRQPPQHIRPRPAHLTTLQPLHMTDRQPRRLRSLPKAQLSRDPRLPQPSAKLDATHGRPTGAGATARAASRQAPRPRTRQATARPPTRCIPSAPRYPRSAPIRQRPEHADSQQRAQRQRERIRPLNARQSHVPHEGYTARTTHTQPHTQARRRRARRRLRIRVRRPSAPRQYLGTTRRARRLGRTHRHPFGGWSLVCTKVGLALCWRGV